MISRSDSNASLSFLRIDGRAEILSVHGTQRKHHDRYIYVGILRRKQNHDC